MRDETDFQKRLATFTNIVLNFARALKLHNQVLVEHHTPHCHYVCGMYPRREDFLLAANVKNLQMLSNSNVGMQCGNVFRHLWQPKCFQPTVRS